jgi:hypothetical protein
LAVANPNDLVDVLHRLVESPALRQQFGLRGRRYVEQVHDADAIAGKFLDVYQDAIDHPTKLDLAPIAELLLHQEQHADAELARLCKRLTYLSTSRNL